MEAVEIDVWHFGLTLPPAAERGLLSAALPREEIPDGAISVATRRRLVAWAAVRMLLGSYLDCPPREVPIRRDARGKPSLERIDAPRFSLSHAADRGLLAVAADREVGVDIERVVARRAFAAMARRWFSEAEQGLIAAQPPDDRVRAFYRLWTAKEACVKKTGEGLRGPIAVEVEPTSRGRMRGAWPANSPQRADCQIVELDLGSEWAAAVAAEGEDWRPRLRQFSVRRP